MCGLQGALRGLHRGKIPADLLGQGDVIVSGSSDLVVRATNALTGDTIAEMTGHQELVRTLEYNEEHGRAVSGSYDASLFVSQHAPWQSLVAH